MMFKFISLIVPVLLLVPSARPDASSCPSGMELNGQCILKPGSSEEDSSLRFSLAPESINPPGISEITAEKRAALQAMTNPVSIGSSSAPVEVVIVFPAGDLDCRDDFAALLQYLKQEYVDAGLVRIALYQMITGKNTDLLKQHKAFLCAAKQDRALVFLRDALSGSAPRSFTSESLPAGLDHDLFRECLSSAATDVRMDNSLQNHVSQLGLGRSPLIFLDNREITACTSFKGIRSIVEVRLREIQAKTSGDVIESLP